MWAKCNLFLLGFLLCSCSLVTGKNVNTAFKAGIEVSFLSIAINSSGDLVISVSPSLTVPTPLGSFGLFTEAEFTFEDISSSFPDKQILIIQATQKQWVYDLHDQQIEITLNNVDAAITSNGRGNILVKISDETSNRQPEFRYIPSPQPYSQTCPGAFSTRLEKGQNAIVVPFQVKVFTGAGTHYPLAQHKYLKKGRRMIVLDGPVCNGGMLWWEIQSEELTLSNGQQGIIHGWIPEESGDEWMLEPIH
ncbi:MAG: hypothetical protein H6668_18615 [Ardenticatenaceae bacterium]|nr:hypothetical protein [Ardenticatenaceae bacterium]